MESMTAEPASLHLDDPALLGLALSRAAAGPERTRALHLLGWTPCAEVTVLAALGPVGHVDDLAASLRHSGASPRRAIIDRVHAMAVDGPLPAAVSVPTSVMIGVGATGFAVSAATSFEQAVRALRYATSVADAGVTARPVVHAAELGPFAFLAGTLRSDDIRGVADVDLLDELAATPGGQGVVQALEAVAQAGSLREAARRLHLHHNSVAARVRRAEDVLTYRVTDPAGVARLQLALALRRLRTTDLLA
jgi:hypothetical protein